MKMDENGIQNEKCMLRFFSLFFFFSKASRSSWLFDVQRENLWNLGRKENGNKISHWLKAQVAISFCNIRSKNKESRGPQRSLLAIKHSVFPWLFFHWKETFRLIFLLQTGLLKKTLNNLIIFYSWLRWF